VPVGQHLDVNGSHSTVSSSSRGRISPRLTASGHSRSPLEAPIYPGGYHNRDSYDVGAISSSAHVPPAGYGSNIQQPMFNNPLAYNEDHQLQLQTAVIDHVWHGNIFQGYHTFNSLHADSNLSFAYGGAEALPQPPLMSPLVSSYQYIYHQPPARSRDLDALNEMTPSLPAFDSQYQHQVVYTGSGKSSS
jgi:hypothetical protein